MRTSGGVTPGPFVSVIVVAYTRTSFLKQAVESILNQQSVKGEVEVVVSKSFQDPHLDKWFEDAGVRVLTNSDSRAGKRLAEAVEVVRGEVVSFLDDDDLFSPDKIRSVRELFQKDPRLGYYHNGVLVVDDSNRPITPPPILGRRLRAIARHSPVKLSRGNLGSALRLLPPIDVDFNVSSISIRREILKQRLTELREIPLSCDSFCFYSTLLTDYNLLIDDAKLTRYRVHSSNLGTVRTTPQRDSDRNSDQISARLLQSYELIYKMVAPVALSAVTKDIRALILVGRLKRALIGQAHSRVGMVRAIWSVVHDCPDYWIRKTFVDLVWAVLYVISPRLSLYSMKAFEHRFVDSILAPNNLT